MIEKNAPEDFPHARSPQQPPTAMSQLVIDTAADGLLERFLKPNPLLVIISGPSGVGKDVVIARMKRLGEELDLPLHFIVTATTRQPRPGEQNGRDYFFVTREQFEDWIAKGELLEYTTYADNYYGIPKHQIREAMLLRRQDSVMRIDVNGADTMRRLVPNAVQIFLAPPSMEELAFRLRQRGTETIDELATRYMLAPEEMKRMNEFDYVVINHHDRIDDAVAQIIAIIRAEKANVHQREIRI